ncbi:MAG: hypothetical protein H7312_27220 [Tardiphaga sp.]|nr:hypothetical protein [Tardiphaga sp.]
MGYAEFELNIPEVIREKLPDYFDGLSADPLLLENVVRIPLGVQGAYMLFYPNDLVCIGKTDAEAGFRSRLTRHFHSITALPNRVIMYRENRDYDQQLEVMRSK